jgi:conserved hypothetical protein
MSFTTEIKQELCRVTNTADTALAECLGMLLFAGQLTRQQLRIQIENGTVRRRVETLFRQALDVEPDNQDNVLLVTDREELARIYAAFGYETGNTLPLNRVIVEEDACKSAFLRGAFLVGGYVSTPDKGYHLELVTPHYHVSRQVSALLQDMELPAGLVMRRGVYVLYYKDSAAIEDFLSAAGATAAAMELMLKKVERELRNDVNRKVNCETANLFKTVGAAARQIEAIEALKQSGRLEQLPPPLRETAQLRLDHPDLSLSELCALSPTPISRPGLNNRLRRLVALSEEENA